MSRQTELAKNTLILTIGKVCTQFVSFLLLPLYTALLIPEEFGIVDLFNTYITLLVPIVNWQFESGLFRFMLDCREKKQVQKEIFSTVIIANILQSFIYLLFFGILQNLIHSEYKIFLALDVVANIFLNSMLQFSRGLGKNVTYSIASFISAAITIVFNVIFIAGFRMGAYGMFLATVLAKLIAIVYLFLFTKTWNYFSIFLFKKHLFKVIFKYSIPLVPNQLSWWIVNASDRSIIAYFISTTANGIYSIANKFSSIYVMFFSIFNLSWTETVSLHLNDEDREYFLTETINTIFRLFSALCLGIIACMPFVFPIMINTQYLDAYYQVPILMFAVLFQVIVGLYSAIYIALKKSIEIAKTSFGAAIINILVDFALIKFIGLYAASLSTLIAYAVMSIYRYFDVKKYVVITFNKKLLCSTIIVGILTTISYYCNIFFLNIITLGTVIIYSIVINRIFIKTIMKGFVKKSFNKS